MCSSHRDMKLRRKDRNQNPFSNKYKIWGFLCLFSRGIILLKITIICIFQHVFFKRMCTKYTFQITIIFNFLVPFKKDLIKRMDCIAFYKTFCAEIPIVCTRLNPPLLTTTTFHEQKSHTWNRLKDKKTCLLFFSP